MKLVITKNLENNNFGVILDVADVTAEDKELFKDFGEPTFNIGGKLTETKQVEITKDVPLTPLTPAKPLADTEEEGEAVEVDEEGISTKAVVEAKETLGKVITEFDEDGITGEFLEVETVVADLGNIYRKFPSEFPIERVFTKAEFGDNAEKAAMLYIDLITERAKGILDSYKTKRDTFSGTTEVQL